MMGSGKMLSVGMINGFHRKRKYWLGGETWVRVGAGVVGPERLEYV